MSSTPGANGAPPTRMSSFEAMCSPTINTIKTLNNRVRTNSSSSALQLSPSNEDVADDGSYGFIEEEDEDAPLSPGENNNITTPRGTKNVGQFDLCGSMWKRRGGLGRNAERNWVMRCFTLYGPILCYHEEPEIESVADPSNPRARLNLSKTDIIAEMHSKQKRGLPTEDLLTINIYDPIIHAKRKWEMCCTSKEQQQVWYNAINAYNGKPDRVTEKGGEHDNALSPVQNKFTMPDLSNYSESRIRPAAQHGGAVMMDDVELIAKAAAKAAEIMIEKQTKERNTLSKLHVAMIIVAFNVAMRTVRNGSEEAYKMTVFFMNAIVLYFTFQYASATGNTTSSRGGPKARAAKSQKRTTDVEGKAHSPRSPASVNQKTFAKTLPVGKTIPRAAPTKNSELESQLQTHPPNSAETVRAYAAAPTSSIEIVPHSYANTDAKMFNLRVGPNYKKNKQKAPSGPALYDLVSMDFLYADTALKNTADKFCLPSIPGITDVSTGHAHIPPMMVINTWLPGEEPSVFAKNTDGETYSIPTVLVLSKDTLEQLKDIDTASPGVKLLSEWCRRAETESDFRGRFKCMGMIENIESTGVPKFIQGYNGKPALVTKSGTFKRHDNYIEFTINVNMWAFLAKKGLHTLIPTFPDFIFNVGFTIEARNDEEMPEVLLGGCRLLNLDPERAAVDGIDV